MISGDEGDELTQRRHFRGGQFEQLGVAQVVKTTEKSESQVNQD